MAIYSFLLPLMSPIWGETSIVVWTTQAYCAAPAWLLSWSQS